MASFPVVRDEKGRLVLCDQPNLEQDCYCRRAAGHPDYHKYWNRFRANSKLHKSITWPRQPSDSCLQPAQPFADGPRSIKVRREVPFSLAGCWLPNKGGDNNVPLVN